MAPSPRRSAVELARSASRVLEAIRRLNEGATAALGPLLTSALAPAERVALGRALDADAAGPEPRPSGEPFDWERDWWASALPPAPARLLLGGAGAGREARVLDAAGRFRALSATAARTDGPILASVWSCEAFPR